MSSITGGLAERAEECGFSDDGAVRDAAEQTPESEQSSTSRQAASHCRGGFNMHHGRVDHV